MEDAFLSMLRRMKMGSTNCQVTYKMSHVRGGVPDFDLPIVKLVMYLRISS